jgi:hypothetical protein
MTYYDLNGRGLVQEGMTIADYIKSLVDDVTAQVGEEVVQRDYKFYMTSEMWERIVNVYACLTSDAELAQVPLQMIQKLKWEMKHYRTLGVNGVAYAVVLDDADCPPNEIWFMSDLVNPEEEDAPRISQIGRD